VRVPGWGAEDPLDATWVHLRCRQDGQELLLLNTQFDDESEDSRVRSAELIVARLDRLQADRGDIPVVVTGDFNCTPGTRPYRVFIEDGFVDTFLAAKNEDDGDAYTFHAFKGARFTPADTDKPTGRIDWILIRDDAGRVMVRSHEILRDGDEAAGIYPSDHYPVLARLDLTG